MSNENWPDHLKRSAVARVNPFENLNPAELQWLTLIGERGATMARVWFRERRGIEIEISPQIIAMDFALAHLANPIRLEALYHANDLDFMDDFATVTRNVQRTLAFFPRDVRLRFAAPSGLILN